MIVARVIGNIWATRKEEKLSGLKLLVLRQVDLCGAGVPGTPIVAADTIGAGVGELVLMVSGSTARNAAGGNDIPVDATIVGIVDGQDIDASVIE